MYYFPTLNTFSEYPTITVDGEVLYGDKNQELYDERQKEMTEKIHNEIEKQENMILLLSLKKQIESAKIEYDATVSLIDSIKTPMRAEIKKKQERLDKEFEALFNEMIKTEDKISLIQALCS